MWFVLACESPDDVAEAAAQIEQDTGLAVLRFPRLNEFFTRFRAET
jgi:siroheme decarboxylase